MEAHISYIYASYVIDPQVYGLDASIWKTVSGTPAVVSNKYRLNTAEMVSYSQFRFGEFEFNATVPVAPTAADNRVIGLVGKSLGNRGRIAFVFNTSGELRAQVYDRYGVSLYDELIPWDATWDAAATLFRIGWNSNVVKFTVSDDDGTNLYTTTYQSGKEIISLPLSLQILNGNADNLDITGVTVIASAPSLPINGGSSIASVLPGTGATNLGKAEDAAHTSGDVGVMSLAVRKDTPTALAGTDGDYSPVITDANNLLWVTLGTKISGEDQTNDKMKVEQQFSPAYIATATTTTIRSGAGLLHSITITESVASTIIVYDNTAGSGTILASFVASAGVGTYLLDVVYGTGLTVVTAGASKLTVSYR